MTDKFSTIAEHIASSLAIARSQIGNLQTLYERYKLERDAVQVTLEATNSAAQNRIEELSSALKRIAELETRLNEAQAECNAAYSSIATLKNECERIRNTLSDTLQENEKLKASQKAYFHSIDHMSLEVMRDEIKRVGAMVASLYNAQDTRSDARKAFDESRVGDLGQL